MKRLTIIVWVIALSSMVAFSQNSAQTKSMEEVKQYIDKNVFSLVEKQQASYFSKLSEDETNELNSIREEISNRKPEFSEGKQMYARGKNPKNKLDKSRNGTMMVVSKITDAHPKLNAAYEETINKNKQIWIADIIAIHEKNDAQPMHSKDGKIGIEMFFTRMLSPEWLLLWDSTNPRMTNIKGTITQNDFKQQKPPVGKRNSNPELRADIKLYVTKNILPVITEERKNFDKLLSANEKKIIETARQKIEVRKIMFKNWYESDDFEAGKRAKDENFDGMRTDMRNSMTEVGEIALAHKMEIRESIAEIKSHSDKWKNEISTISESNNQDPDKTNRIIRQRMHKSQTPISFLLFNPDKAAEADLFGFDKEDEMKVILYPNPIYENGTIAIINAIDKNVQVILFTKDGETLRTLYQGQNKKQRLEVMINVSELSNDIYLVKVVTENVKVVRKIVVKH
jgi:hypothetical protein